VARSPIAPAPPVVAVAGWQVSGARATSPLTLADCTPLAKVLLRAPAGGSVAALIRIPFGRAVRNAAVPAAAQKASGPGAAGTYPSGASRNAADSGVPGVLIAGSGPGEWLAIGPPGCGPELVDRLAALAAGAPQEHVSLVDLTHGRALMRLAGPQSADVLACVCGIDLSDAITPDGAAFRTGVAAVATDIIRDDSGGSPSYLLHCERSSGQYLFDALLQAGARFGIEIDGFASPGT
jgi:heterotetrameric sarcosine oxidase gamma subunit